MNEKLQYENKVMVLGLKTLHLHQFSFLFYSFLQTRKYLQQLLLMITIKLPILI